MSVTIAKVFPGHWVTTYTTTTTVTVAGGVGTAVSDTSSSDSFHYGVNQWGQAGVQISFYNESDKEIKYIEFEVIPLNSVNDPVASPCKLTGTGPIKPHSANKRTWGFVWTNSSIRAVGILECKVLYSDGTIETQSLLAGAGKKELYFDGSVGEPNTWPAILTSVLLLAAVASQFIGNGRYRGRHSVFASDSFLPFQPWIQFALIVVFVYAAFILTRRMKNKTGTLGASLAALVCCLMSFSPRIGISSFLLRANYYSNPAIYITFMPFASFIGTVIMLVLLVLSAANVFKKYMIRHDHSVI